MLDNITRLDILIIALGMIFLLDIIAVLTNATQASFVTVCGAIVTIIGYAFIRPEVANCLAYCKHNGR